MLRRSSLLPSLLLAIASFAIYVLAFVLQTRIAALPEDFARETLSYPVQVGDVVVENADRLRFVAEGASPGAELTIVDARGDVYHTQAVRRRDLAYMIVIGISGLFFWSVTNLIFAPRFKRPGAGNFFWLTFLYGLSVVIGGIYFPGDRSWVSYAMGYLQLAILAVLPLLLLHLSLTFPYRSGFLDRAKWMIPLLAVAAVVVVAWQVFAFHRYFVDPGPRTGASLGMPQIAADGLLVAQTLAGFAVMFTRAIRSDDMLIKSQIYWILWGFTLGTAPYVLLRTLPSIFGVSTPIPSHVDRVFELAIPAGFVAAVIQHRFLDIDIILRRGLMYTVLAGLAILFYVPLGLALSGYFDARVSGWAGILLILLGLAAGLSFRPMRRLIGFRVDRTFFKLMVDYDRACDEFRRALASASGQEDMVRLVARRIAHALHPLAISVIVREGEDHRVAGDLSPDAALDAFRACVAHAGTMDATIASPGSTGAPRREWADFPASLLASGIIVVSPIRDGDTLLGLIMLGRRKTERLYIDRDLNFLDACAEATRESLLRIELVQRMSAETIERLRLDELNRHKTEYLSRVSHDLRTPLASIRWSSENLKDGVAGALNDQQSHYVEAIRLASGHLAQLVANLLAVSQIDQVQDRPEPEAVPLVPVLEEVVTAMTPLAEQEGVSFQLQTGASSSLVAGQASRLREVITNLLDNAVRFSPPGSAVDVVVDHGDAELVSIQIRDHGPGIDAGATDTLFERHTQGARSPYSSRQGFGLGLHIVKTYVEQMGGNIEAGNHPNGGALFTCRLRRWPVPREERE